MNVRSVLDYVPYFRGKLFVVHIDEELLPAEELVDALLDIDALHEIGVRLVIVAEGEDISSIARRAGECEMHSAEAELPLTAGEPAIARVQEIVARRQVAFVASGVRGRFEQPTVSMALALHADKYICLQSGEVPSLKGQPIFAMLEKEAATCTDCTCPELLHRAAALCRQGISRVHMLDGLRRGVLLDELFSEEGVGTMVHVDSYRTIRPLQEDDIPELLSMIARSIVNCELVPRNYETIRDNLSSYYVYTLDDTIVGCVALYPFESEHSAELGCLFIKKNYEGHGYGKALCHFVEELARSRGYNRIFAISQSAVPYFRDRLGYESVSRDCLPEPRRSALVSSGRSSSVFVRNLIKSE